MEILLLLKLMVVGGNMQKERKEINIQIGKAIKEARECANLTQARFAEMVQLGTKNVSAIECGNVGVSLETLKRICTVLSVSSDHILFGEQTENNISFLMERLKRLTEEQLDITVDIVNKLLEAFALNENSK